ncbi:MAG TPA: phosphoglucosamine mutase, partial [Gemmatales bacterium]|nr:phosphoglucosamine mutase [Gemmatales bacterium]
EVVLAFAQALGTQLEGQPVVMGRDSRPSGEMFGDLVAAGLASSGCDVHDLGICPTPSVGVIIQHLRTGGGVQVSASHNPSPYNGLKFFGDDGSVLGPEAGAVLLDVLHGGRRARADHAHVGQRLRHDLLLDESEVHYLDYADVHQDAILRHVDRGPLRQRRFRVLVDANHGAGGYLAERLLHTLGCEVDLLGDTPDGEFSHPPEPTEENLRDVAPRVLQGEADVGFALDPDADRLAIIDETGRYIGEELTLALAARFLLARQPGAVVINMSSSRVTADLARQFGCPSHRSPVGEAHVVRRMRAEGAVLGGEGNGGVIDPRVGWVRDPFIGMALVLSLMAETGQPLSALVDSLPRYTIVKDKIQLEPAALTAFLGALRRHWPDAEVNEEDGLRLEGPTWWLHARPSNTEPLVRIIAEAPERAQAAELVAAARRLCG